MHDLASNNKHGHGVEGSGTEDTSLVGALQFSFHCHGCQRCS